MLTMTASIAINSKGEKITNPIADANMSNVRFAK
jgi:hypothetical protein